VINLTPYVIFVGQNIALIPPMKMEGVDKLRGTQLLLQLNNPEILAAMQDMKSASKNIQMYLAKLGVPSEAKYTEWGVAVVIPSRKVDIQDGLGTHSVHCQVTVALDPMSGLIRK
jgi:hypothetical protein